MTQDKTPTDALAQLRHLYANLTNGGVRDTASAKRIAEGLLSPAIAALERWGSPVVAGEPNVKYVPVDSKLKDKHWNHPNDDEPRTEACREALRDRGDDRGQGLDGYWKWGFAAGFNAALSTTPQPTQAQAGAVPLTKAELTKRAKVGPIHTERGDKVVLFLATYCNELENRFTTGWREAERYHGIQGGQHGTE